MDMNKSGKYVFNMDNVKQYGYLYNLDMDTNEKYAYQI